MMKNISHIHKCFGCGVCTASCPKNIISIKLNKNGFYEPYIERKKDCIGCGICLDICAFNHKELSLKPQNISMESWAGWSKDKDIRKKCSSGGISFEIGRQLIKQGYQVVGCRYDIKKQRAEHYIASTVKELIQSIGSKYIQSYTEEAFKYIDKKKKYLIVGTPCQIDSFRRMIQRFHCEENFVLLDFFCHCVPSMLAWKAYLKMLEPILGKITYASWRNKYEYGWHDSWLMGIDGENTSEPVNWRNSYNFLIKEKKTAVQSRWSHGDHFYKLFLGDACLGPQCEKQCKYKYDRSSADIRIGDLWGKTYENNEKGVSAVVSFTEKGREVVKRLKEVTLVEHPFNVVAEGQMTHNARAIETAPLVMLGLRHGLPINGVAFKLIEICQMMITKIKLMLK